MIHAAASWTPDGDALIVTHGRRIRCDVLDLVDDARSLAHGRAHVSVWVRDLDDLLLRYADAGRSMHGARMARTGPSAYHCGRVHVRCADMMADDPPHGADEFFNEIGYLGELYERVTGLEMAGTGAQCAHSVFKDRARAWRTPGSWDTPFCDWVRSAMYAGRLVVHHGGIVHAHRHRDAQRHARRTGAPLGRLDPGWELARVDIKSAYPWALTHRLPCVWSTPVQGHDGEPWTEYKHGVAHVRTDMGAGRVVPVRVRTDEGAVTRWPRKGTATQPMTFESIRTAVAHGASVECVRAPVGDGWSWCAWPMRDAYARRAVETLALLESECSPEYPWARAACKGLGRRLYGGFAAGRWSMEAIPLIDAIDQGIVPRAILGDTAIVTRIAEIYPARAQPLWAAYATSRVAVQLVDAEDAVTAAGGLPLYADTDGLLAAVPVGAFPGVETGDRIGDWREDWRGGWAAIMGPRWYVLGGTRIRTAGIPRDCASVLWSEGEVTVSNRRTVCSPARSWPARIAWTKEDHDHGRRTGTDGQRDPLGWWRRAAAAAGAGGAGSARGQAAGAAG